MTCEENILLAAGRCDRIHNRQELIGVDSWTCQYLTSNLLNPINTSQTGQTRDPDFWFIKCGPCARITEW